MDRTVCSQWKNMKAYWKLLWKIWKRRALWKINSNGWSSMKIRSWWNCSGKKFLSKEISKNRKWTRRFPLQVDFVCIYDGIKISYAKDGYAPSNISRNDEIKILKNDIFSNCLKSIFRYYIILVSFNFMTSDILKLSFVIDF